MPADDGYEAGPETARRAPSVTNGAKKHPCLLCQQRKIRCDRKLPCANCQKLSAECISPNSLPPRKRKRRFPEAELLARIRKYEHHLRSYGADIDAINAEDVPLDITAPKSSSPDEIPIHENRKTLSGRRSLRHVMNNLWDGVNGEFREAEELLQGSSEDEMFENSISKTYDYLAATSNNSDFLFGSRPVENLLHLHPSPVQIFRLWQTFLDNCDPLIKIFHAPSVQQQILEATANLENLPKGLEALMFGVYALATRSLKSEDCENMFGEDRMVLVERYQLGAQQALLNADYMRTSDLAVLQAFTIYLVISTIGNSLFFSSIKLLETRKKTLLKECMLFDVSLSTLQLTHDPRTLVCLGGVAVRCAQRIGLSSDGTTYGLLPFETEMRRRLWWQIVMLDVRLGELSGAGSTILTYSWNTKLPSNVNDSDLYVPMRESPPDREGITEMLFVRLRCEHLEVSRKLRVCNQAAAQEKVLDDFEAQIERGYLSHCDPLVPIHFASLVMARTAFCKLRSLQTHMMFSLSKNHANIPQHEKDTVFGYALTMVENQNLALSSPLTQKYLWLFYQHNPFPAKIYLICALRERTTGKQADKAWRLLEETYTHLGFLKHHQTRDSALHLAAANITLKAWDARVAAHGQSQPSLPTPTFISTMRHQLAMKKSQSPGATPNILSVEQNNGFEHNSGRGMQMFDTDPFPADLGLNQQQYGTFVPTEPPMDWSFWSGMMLQDGPPMQTFDGIFQHGYPSN